MSKFKLLPKLKALCVLGLLSLSINPTTFAHHSFAMYDSKKSIVFTGVVTRVTPDPAHLQIFFVPLNEERTAIIRDEAGEPVQWAVEMQDAARTAAQGITVNSFPRGSIISVGLHPQRNGRPAGGRGDFGLYKCPDNTPPAFGMHCDSVEGATRHGPGELPGAEH